MAIAEALAVALRQIGENPMADATQEIPTYNICASGEH